MNSELLLRREASRVRDSGVGLSHYRIAVRINNGKQWITPITVLHYALERNYANAFGDKHYVTVMMGKGDYNFDIHPQRDSLSVDITSVPTFNSRGGVRTDTDGELVKRYRAVLLNQKDPSVEDTTHYRAMKHTLNISDIVVVELELFDEAVHQIRMATTGGIYRDKAPMEVLRETLQNTLNLVSTDNRQIISSIIEMPGFNETKRKQVVVPPTRVVDLAQYLQVKEGGVYSTGVGCYLQDNTWHVFCPYNIKLYQKTSKTLSITLMNSNDFDGERTYCVSGDSVTVLTSTDRSVLDEGMSSQLNGSTGHRFINADTLMDGFATTSANKTTISRKTNLYEFSGEKMMDGLNNIQWAEKGASSNPFQYYSELAKQSGRIITVTWNHGDTDLLEPGMSVKIKAPSHDDIATYQGTLLGVMKNCQPINEGSVRRLFIPVIQLTLFVSRVSFE